MLYLGQSWRREGLLRGAFGSVRLSWSVAIVSGIYLAQAALIVWLSAGPPEWASGVFVYPLDDTYIHLALAKAFGNTGIWGVSEGIPGGASSSPLWSVLLALVTPLHLGPSAYSWVPFALNIIFGLGVVLILCRMFNGYPLNWASALAVVCLIPLAPLTFIGMEHVLHVLLCFCLSWWSLVVCRSDSTNQLRYALVAILAGLAVSTRYESLFLVAPLCAVGLFRRDLRLFFCLLIGAVLPVVGFGALWIWQDNFFLPNSLLLKSVGGKQVSLLQKVLEIRSNLAMNTKKSIGQIMLVLLPAVYVAAFLRSRTWLAWSVVASVAAMLHFSLASVGWLFRYEAWIVGLAVTGALLVSHEAFETKTAFAVAVIAILILLAPRSLRMSRDAVRATSDRVWEHFAVTAVLDRLPGRPILINDIGVPAYFAPAKIFDIYGLGNNEPVRLRRENGYPAGEVRSLTQQLGAESAVLQICWRQIHQRLPQEWILVGLWKGPRNVVFKDLWVAFFATVPGSVGQIEETLRELKPGYGIEYFGPSSSQVSAYNDAYDKKAAAAKLCKKIEMAGD
jgi:hypothetical protein